ncbi:hypothetical protein [Nitrosococcus watsonii]|uniref:DUF3618 domain-containing protein n=1 Tax=Nitrosococcus watsoni (strain C-113) TaxID=105559 RepID=D8K6B1_NITWC|nr:hypothetical protein [Nitrosococcus watsonii]ADJ28438.1 conserved hypothetical protein [Nitrosococcus watsonii C-113]
MDKTYSSQGDSPPGTGVKDQARQEAHRLTDKAKEQGRDLLADRKRATADEIGSVAEALRKTAQEMHQQEHPPLITPYAEKAANSLERFSNTLREGDLNVLVQQTENFARRQPGVFLGGAVVTGFLLARFFRSSELHSEYDYAQPSSGGGLSTSNSGAAGSSFASSSTGSTTVSPTTPPPYSTAMPTSSAGPMGSSSTTETTPANTQPKGDL